MGMRMGKSVALLIVLIFLTSLCVMAVASVSAATEDSWESKAPMNVARANFGIAVVDGKIYAFGGDSGSVTGSGPAAEARTANTLNTNEVYDPTTDTWAFKKPMPTARALLGVAVYQNKVYCIGGYYGSANDKYFNTGVNEVYDPATDTWETRAPMPTVDSRFATANVVNGKIYVISYTLNQAYDPETDSWTTKTPPLYRISSKGVSVVVDSKIHFIGIRTDGDGVWTGAFIQAYNPSDDSWTVIAESPTYGFSGTAGATTGVNAFRRIYFFDETATHVYDPESNTWTVGASKLSARYLARVAVVNDVFYVVGGRSGQVSPFTWVDPSAVNEQYTPFGYGSPDPSYDGTAPEIAVLSPENMTYYTTDVALNFTVNEPSSWMRYSLDGNTTVEISGNTTLTELSYGSHNVTVYTTDAAGNAGTSETIIFTVAEETEPFPTAPVAGASVATVAVVGVGLLLYFKKRKR
jgi:hypothetical protein